GSVLTSRLTAQSGLISAVIAGTDFVKSGAGELILSGTNVYTGATTVNGGTLTVQYAGAIPADSEVRVLGGIFNLASATLTNHFVVAGGELTGGTVNLDQLTATTGAISANIEGDLGFTKDSAGVLTLGGFNSFTGGVNITAGTLQLASATAVGGNAVTVAGGTLNLGQQVIANGVTLNSGAITNGTLALSQLTANAGTVAADLTGTGGFNRDGAGVLTLAGANTFTGGVTVTSGTLVAGSVGAFGANVVTVNGGVLDLGQQAVANSFTLNGGALVNGTLALGKVTANAGTLGAKLTGTTGFTKTGNGVLTLSGANTYTGGTTVNAGTLTAGSATAFSTGAVTIAGGFLDLGGQTIANNVTIAGGELTGGAINAGQVTLASGSISATLTGSGTLTKSGTGTFTLESANTYAGGTNLSGGKL
ncbi:MAG: hypothetical protein EBT98_12995, partial [Opitutaceae bacterium]|nr:hypothetical protein [Opitutaceae bacterium]